jgi:type IV secretion system protein VirB8
MTGALVVEAGKASDYFARSKTFDGERVEAAIRSGKRAWWIAGVQTALAALSSLAVVCMLPLRTVEVYVFRVDNATGVVDLVNGSVGKQTYTEAVTKYWAANYVRARESYLADQARLNFQTAALMSDEREQRRMSEQWSISNPLSPVVVLGRDGTARVDIKSISFLSVKVALVRFSRSIEKSSEKKMANFLATLTFHYVEGPATEAERLLNPLGFQVYEYSVVPEAP